MITIIKKRIYISIIPLSFLIVSGFGQDTHLCQWTEFVDFSLEVELHEIGDSSIFIKQLEGDKIQQHHHVELIEFFKGKKIGWGNKIADTEVLSINDSIIELKPITAPERTDGIFQMASAFLNAKIERSLRVSVYTKKEKQVHVEKHKSDTGIALGCKCWSDKLGTWEYYDNENQLIKIENYNDEGKLHGPYYSFYPEGDTLSSGFFSKGLKEGEWQDHYQNGFLSFSGNYHSGEPEGSQLWFDTLGRKKNEKYYLLADEKPTRYNDYYVQKEWYPNGFLKLEYMVQVSFTGEEKKTGKYSYYYENGQLEITSVYDSDIKDGEEKEYHRNGQLIRQSNYGWGKLHGEQFKYHPNGQLKEKCRYSYKGGDDEDIWMAVLVGEYVSYYDSGQIEEIGSYGTIWEGTKGLKRKKWITYYPNGQKSSQGKYEDGKKIGKWKYWSESGKRTTID